MSANTALDDIKARVEGHTEGPWEVSEFIKELFSPADAELIAAAPKLLAALEAVEALHVPVIENGEPVGCRVCDWEEDGGWPCSTMTAITDALA